MSGGPFLLDQLAGSQSQQGADNCAYNCHEQLILISFEKIAFFIFIQKNECAVTLKILRK